MTEMHDYLIWGSFALLYISLVLLKEKTLDGRNRASVFFLFLSSLFANLI